MHSCCGGMALVQPLFDLHIREIQMGLEENRKENVLSFEKRFFGILTSSGISIFFL